MDATQTKDAAGPDVPAPPDCHGKPGAEVAAVTSKRDSRAGALRPRLASPSLMAATIAAGLVALPAIADADPTQVPGDVEVQVQPGAQVGGPGPGVYVGHEVRDFYPYYSPYCPHQYWQFLYGVPPASPQACGPPVVIVAAAPGTVQVAAAEPEPELPSLGVGVFGGAVQVRGQRDEPDTDVGFIARLRLSRHLQLETELSRTESRDSPRTDKRLGGALLLQLVPEGPLSPYLLGGGGFGRAVLENGDFTADQPYGELGVGLELAVSRHLSLFGDARAAVRDRDTLHEDRATLLRSGGTRAEVDDHERFTRARVGALLYF